jgi:glyoxylase-like metal-dependent hydrolase (beta-lactamase superfamily II)/ferredoxin
MADRALRLPHNTPGGFFVDSTCIDCDQCRAVAPASFRDAGGEASVYRQPSSPEETRRALMALVTCPVGAIGSEQPREFREAIRDAQSSFPELVEDNVYFCGYSSRNSFGASSYLIVRPEGNVLVDSPRFSSLLVERIERMGGIRLMFLSHIDDIADHAKYRRHFGCERVIHSREVRAGIADMERIIKGDEAQALADDLIAIPTPGHTRGHMVLLYRKKFLFTGDHLWWSPVRRRLSASRAHCWYSWEEQKKSMERLLGETFEWVLPGHGRRHHASASEMHKLVASALAQMSEAK